MSATRTAATLTATFLWRSTRGILTAFGIGAVFAFGARGMADAGVSSTWLWLWGIAGFVAFTGGLAFWAVNASKSWAPATTECPARRARPARAPALVDADTLTYWYGAGLTLLLNMLATGMLIAGVDTAGYLGALVPVGAVCNLAGYAVIVGALRTGQIQDT